MPDPVLTLPNSGGLSGLGNDARGLGDILGLLFGNSQTTNTTNTTGPSTRTTQNIVDPAGIGKIIQDMLEGDKATNGLAALLTGQNAGGMYNASSANLMVNDLVSRIVGEIAKVTATKVETNSGQTNTSSSNTSTPGKAKQAAGLGAAAAAMKAASNKGGGVRVPGVTGLGTDPKNLNLESDLSKGDTADDNGGTPREFSGDEYAGAADELTGADRSARDEEALDNDERMGDLSSLSDGGDEYTGGEEDIIPDAGDSGDFSGDGSLDYLDGIGDEDMGGGEEDGGGGEIEPSDEECFITTAVVHEMGLPDNCAELETLRYFRDDWMKENHPEDVAAYKIVGPQIVNYINGFTNRAMMWRQLYREFILPAVLLVLAGKNQEAYEFYKANVNALNPGV